MKAKPVLSRQNGGAIVEFIFVLPLLLLLMLSTAELGHAFYQYNTLTKAVRDGARYLSANALLGSTGIISISSALRTETRNLVVYGNTAGSGDPLIPAFTDISTVIANAAGTEHVRVAATYDYVPMLFPATLCLPTFVSGGCIDLDFDLNASTTMRAL